MLRGVRGPFACGLLELQPTFRAAESWLRETQDASILEYETHWQGFEAIIRPLAEQF